MPRSKEDDYLITVLKSKFDASLERNRLLEEENKELKQELFRLSSQLESFRAQAAERKAALLRRFHKSSIDKPSYNKQTIQSDVVIDGPGELQVFSSRTFSKTTPRVPNPPPKPSHHVPRPTAIKTGGKDAPPPPPPPPPSKLFKSSQADKIRRAPEVIELYQILTRSESNNKARTAVPGTASCVNTREMIGEIENRSSYLLAQIKSDVETQSDFIKLLAREIEDADHRDISDVEAFVKWLDGELSSLADERAVLKHFPWWPEQRVDAMREAACGYRDLRNLGSEAFSFHNDLHQPIATRLKRIQMIQDKLEQSVQTVQRMRESAIRKYKQFKIPWEWLQDTGMISTLKGGTLKLGKEYMKNIVIELKSSTGSEEELLILQGVRFMFRIHQFIGGLDAESRQIFQELNKAFSNCQGIAHTEAEVFPPSTQY